MKYLILAVCSLFCLSSFSDHKENPVSEEEKARYKYLFQIEYLSSESLTEEQKKEYYDLKRKIYEERFNLNKHFNSYMWLEYLLFNAEKGDVHAQSRAQLFFKKKHFKLDPNELFPTRRFWIYSPSSIPDCTKERLHKNECPKPPHLAIYWAKRSLYEGKCISRDSESLAELMEFFVIPKTDIRDHESLFYILNYMSVFFYEQSEKPRLLKEFNAFKKRKEEEVKKGDLTQEDFKKQLEKQKTLNKETFQSNKKRKEEVKKKLNERQKEIAHKMISDLIQRWSKKYDKDNLYKTCQENNAILFDTGSKKEFLEKYYHHLD